jgi:hypothetical protein
MTLAADPPLAPTRPGCGRVQCSNATLGGRKKPKWGPLQDKRYFPSRGRPMSEPWPPAGTLGCMIRTEWQTNVWRFAEESHVPDRTDEDGDWEDGETCYRVIHVNTPRTQSGLMQEAGVGANNLCGLSRLDGRPAREPGQRGGGYGALLQ